MSFENLSNFRELCERVRAMHAQNLSAERIGHRLGEEGFRPPKRAERFGPAAVQKLLRLLGLTRRYRRHQVELLEHEWHVADLVAKTDVPQSTLRRWAGFGIVRSRWTDDKPARLILRADPDEIERLRELRHSRPHGCTSPLRWLREKPAAADQEPSA